MLASTAMASSSPARVVWLYSQADESLARSLLRFSALLERQGVLSSWSPRQLLPGSEPQSEADRQIRRADVIVLLISPDFLAEEDAWIDAAFEQQRARDARVVPVLLRSVLLPPPLNQLALLPRNGVPLMQARDRDAALVDVIEGIREVVAYRPKDDEPRGSLESTPQATAPQLTINEIFRLNGPPTVTFVEPPLFPRLLGELSTFGTGLLLEGPSKVGKTTAIIKALERLGVASADTVQWNGARPPALPEFNAALAGLVALPQGRRYLIIEDFHYLEDPAYLKPLALYMKELADLAAPRAKVVLIGINPLGGSLTQSMPDLGGRFRVLRMDREKDWARSSKIADLIVLGEHAANLLFRRREEFILAAGGSFYLAQLLCNQAATQQNIFRPPERQTIIDLGPQDVLDEIQGELEARYKAPLQLFAAFDERPPPRGAGLTLLWLLSRSAEGFVTMQEAQLRFPMLADVFSWLLASNMKRCFDETPQLRGLLYYNRATGTLTVEDPQVRFYLRQLDWAKFAQASGHGQVRFHPEDGPLWVAKSLAVNGQPEAPRRAGSHQVLHLSDLHFGTAEDALGAYAKLAADLRQMGCEHLDAVLVSGDLTQRAAASEFEAARSFLERLGEGFGFGPKRIVVVPGNHDLSWAVSQTAYVLKKRKDLKVEPAAGTFITHGAEVLEIREEEAWRRRFEPFALFYQQLCGEEYPLDPGQQAVLVDLPEAHLTVLGLNSAWEIDHHFRDRASILDSALSRSLLKLGPHDPGVRTRVAMFHHPLRSSGSDYIKDDGFLQQLAVHGFRLALHGHVHKSGAQLYAYDQTVDGRRLDIIGAGTFGAPTHEWVPGYPLQYNLLRFEPGTVTVETRRRQEPTGAWEPDAMWRQGTNNDPAPRYKITL